MALPRCLRDSRRLWGWPNTRCRSSEQEEGKTGGREPRPRADVHPLHSLLTVLGDPTSASEALLHDCQPRAQGRNC